MWLSSFTPVLTFQLHTLRRCQKGLHHAHRLLSAHPLLSREVRKRVDNQPQASQLPPSLAHSISALVSTFYPLFPSSSLASTILRVCCPSPSPFPLILFSSQPPHPALGPITYTSSEIWEPNVTQVPAKEKPGMWELWEASNEWMLFP